jgi:hypothetical protein
MPSMTKEKVLRAGRDHLVLDRIPCVDRSVACLGKSKWFEGRRVFVELLIHVDRIRSSNNMGTLGDERAV